MATLLIFFTVLFAATIIWFRFTRVGFICLIFALLSFVLIGSGYVPVMLIKTIESPFLDTAPPTWKQNNAIVLLGSGITKLPNNAFIPPLFAYSRIYETAKLYSSCAKFHRCTIIISGGDPLKLGRSEAEVYRDALLALGIKSTNIVIESKSNNTYMNAKFTSAIINKLKFDNVVLLTSGIHLKRSLLYFSHFGIHATPFLGDYLEPRITILPTSYNLLITDLALHEYAGIIRFYIYNFFGLNKRPSAPGSP